MKDMHDGGFFSSWGVSTVLWESTIQYESE